ncbi:65_t:CDS:1, partial [Paraglomus occultum]
LTSPLVSAEFTVNKTAISDLINTENAMPAVLEQYFTWEQAPETAILRTKNVLAILQY